MRSLALVKTTAQPAAPPVSQRELLGVIMARASHGSATFGEAEWVVARAGAGERTRALTRELITDLAIRAWIEIRIRGADEVERPMERRLWEFEFSAERNWDGTATECACYALTEKGLGHLHRRQAR